MLHPLRHARLRPGISCLLRERKLLNVSDLSIYLWPISNSDKCLIFTYTDGYLHGELRVVVQTLLKHASGDLLHIRCFKPEGAGRCSSAQTAETGSARSLDVSTPPFTAPAGGQARNVVEQVPSCRLRRHRSLLRPPRIPVSADSLWNQRPAPSTINNARVFVGYAYAACSINVSVLASYVYRGAPGSAPVC